MTLFVVPGCGQPLAAPGVEDELSTIQASTAPTEAMLPPGEDDGAPLPFEPKPRAPAAPGQCRAAPSPSCAGLGIATVLATEPCGDYLPTRGWTFSADEMTLFVHLVVNGVGDGMHAIDVDFVTPHGYLYQRNSLDVWVGNGTPPSGALVATEVDEGRVASTSLPLAATYIQHSRLFGGWHLTVRVDSDPNPVASTYFEITE